MATVHLNRNEQLALAGVGIALILFAPKIGGFLGKQAVGTVTNIAKGAVIETGKAIGIPETDVTMCQIAMNEGRTWDASFYCDAATFLRYVTGVGQ